MRIKEVIMDPSPQFIAFGVVMLVLLAVAVLAIKG